MDKEEPSFPAIQGALFEQRFADWQTLRAEMLRLALMPIPEGRDDREYEERHDALGQRLDDAARLAMTTHAPLSWMVWQKFEILEIALFGNGNTDLFFDRRSIWMLACIKADLLALDIGRVKA